MWFTTLLVVCILVGCLVTWRVLCRRVPGARLGSDEDHKSEDAPEEKVTGSPEPPTHTQANVQVVHKPILRYVSGYDKPDQDAKSQWIEIDLECVEQGHTCVHTVLSTDKTNESERLRAGDIIRLFRDRNFAVPSHFVAAATTSGT